MPELSGKQKAAAVLLSVDPKTAAAVLRNLSEKDLAAMTREMHGLTDIPPQAAFSAVREFAVRSGEDPGITVNPAALRQTLELAVGHDRGGRLFQELGASSGAEEIFQPLRDVPPEELFKLLADEHPQTAAAILAHVEAKLAAAVLNLFTPERRGDIVRRIAGSRQTDTGLLRKLGDILRARGNSPAAGPQKQTAEDLRFKRVAEIINLLGPAAEEQVLKQLTAEAPEAAKKIREMMFTFEDLLTLSDGDMRKVLMSVDTQALAMALKTASEPLKQKVFANLSRRAAETVTEELELLGPKPRSQVRAVQQQIVDTVRKMGSSGEVNLRGGKTEEDPLV